MTSPTPTPRSSSADLVRIAMTRDEHLDDIKRARIWSELEGRLAAPALSPRRWPLVLGASAAGLVAAAAIIALVVRPSAPRDNAFAIPADTAVSAHLGPHTRASLVGPARLELDAVGEATTVHLRRGTLLADFAGGTGRSLQIVTHDARIEIVGTLFAIEVRDGVPTCTSVEHGRVRVTTPAHTVFVNAGQRYCVAEATTIDPIAPSVHEALERHGASIVAANTPVVGTPEIDAPTAVAPAANAPAVTAPAANASAANAPTTPAADAPAQVAGRSASPIASAPSALPTAPASPSPAPIHATATRARPGTSPLSAPRTPPPTTSARSTAPTPMTSTTTSTVPMATPPTSATTPTNTVNAPSLDVAPAENSVVTQQQHAAKPAPQPPQPTRPSAADLYQIADAALTARDLVAADRALATLVAEHRDSRLVEQALFDRARIAHQRRDWRAARQHLAALAAMSSKLLAEPAHWLRCRVDVDARDVNARTCLTEYRVAFPRSPHDLDALALLARLAHAAGGCEAAAIHVDELALRYPRTTLAAGWRTRCPTVPNPTANPKSGAKP